MVAYLPILKGREGEFNAVEHLSPALVRRVLPIFEVDPATDDPTKDAYRFSEKMRDSLPRGLVIAVDVRHLEDPTATGVRRPMRVIADDLEGWRIPMLPVLHLDDSVGRLADARYAADLHRGTAILRLGSDTSDPDDAEAEEALDRLHDQVGLPIEQYHLIVDVSEVRSERDLTRAEPVVRKCVAWAQRYPWRSVTVAAGAMPPSLSHIPFLAPTALQRWDLQLWQRIANLSVQYADYGIAHPRPAGQGRRPKPNLRYTDDKNWWIYRWPEDKTNRPAMYDLCETLLGSEHWPAQGPDLSWGDQQIAARASGHGGPGNATNWRAWTTSHHIAHVADQLTRSRHGDAGSSS